MCATSTVSLVAHHTALVAAAELPRRRPHDLSNAAAAAAIALEMGASAEAVAAELHSFDGLPHRLALAGRIGAVSFHDDSKATAPHATVAALQGFPDAVLIAGGRNKGLDLGDLAAVAAHVRGVVAIGEAASDVIACFSRPVHGRIKLSVADSMSEAVEIALPDGPTGRRRRAVTRMCVVRLVLELPRTGRALHRSRIGSRIAP